MKPNFKRLSMAKVLVQSFEEEARKLALLTMSPLAHTSQKQQIARRIHNLYELRQFYKSTKKGN